MTKPKQNSFSALMSLPARANRVDSVIEENIDPDDELVASLPVSTSAPALIVASHSSVAEEQQPQKPKASEKAQCCISLDWDLRREVNAELERQKQMKIRKSNTLSGLVNELLVEWLAKK